MLDPLGRRAVTALIVLASVVAVASLMLPNTDPGWFTRDPVGARFDPNTTLDAVASDRPTTALEAGRRGYPNTSTGVVESNVGSRFALPRLAEDVFFPASLIAASGLASGLVGRGPPLSFTA